ncbi:hypothetical protein [Schlesneria paludicola]|uniref:hypothetical protein n=1 Tax=Schlesneria paludicola TaxID=360056 RepID=UPI000299FFA4|nr:hypothetical protein [Schlesneria paludicola]
MTNFLPGGRRTIGVVVLLIACIVMGIWLRGRAIATEIAFGPSDQNPTARYKNFYNVPGMSSKGHIEAKSFQQLISGDGITWRRLEATNPDSLLCYPRVWHETRYDAFASLDEYHWRWQLGGFDFGQRRKGLNPGNISVVGSTLEEYAKTEPRVTMSFWTIPYWFIVLSLALVSAWLLLAPRRAKSSKPPVVLESIEPR